METRSLTAVLFTQPHSCQCQQHQALSCQGGEELVANRPWSKPVPADQAKIEEGEDDKDRWIFFLAAGKMKAISNGSYPAFICLLSCGCW